MVDALLGLKAAILDGGLEAWTRAGLPLVAGEVTPKLTSIPELHIDARMTVSVDDIMGDLGQNSYQLVDARASDRFSGATEPLDVKAGHIPGALNRPLNLNLDKRGCFKSPQQLRIEFETLLQHRSGARVVHSCGSGITACHNYFAMVLAGMNATQVYPGSWSEWIRDESRPIEMS